MRNSNFGIVPSHEEFLAAILGKDTTVSTGEFVAAILGEDGSRTERSGGSMRVSQEDWLNAVLYGVPPPSAVAIYEDNFNPDEPRDETGRWTADGSSGGSPSATHPNTGGRLGKSTVPDALKQRQIVLFFGHHVPSRKTDENRREVGSVSGWDEIEAALVKMFAKTWQAQGQSLPDGATVDTLTLDQAIALAKTKKDFLPKDACVAGVGCFPPSLENTIDDLFPGKSLPGADSPIKADRLTGTDEDVAIALDQFKASLAQARKWADDKSQERPPTVRLYVDSDFLRGVRLYVRAQMGTADRRTKVLLHDFQQACEKGTFQLN